MLKLTHISRIGNSRRTYMRCCCVFENVRHNKELPHQPTKQTLCSKTLGVNIQLASAGRALAPRAIYRPINHI